MDAIFHRLNSLSTTVKLVWLSRIFQAGGWLTSSAADSANRRRQRCEISHVSARMHRWRVLLHEIFFFPSSVPPVVRPSRIIGHRNDDVYSGICQSLAAHPRLGLTEAPIWSYRSENCKYVRCGRASVINFTPSGTSRNVLMRDYDWGASPRACWCNYGMQILTTRMGSSQQVRLWTITGLAEVMRGTNSCG